MFCENSLGFLAAPPSGPETLPTCEPSTFLLLLSTFTIVCVRLGLEIFNTVFVLSFLVKQTPQA